MGAPVNPIWNQQSYAFYNDGTESASTIIGAANASQSLDTDTTYQLRFLVQETNGSNQGDDLTVRLQYRLNAGTWTSVSSTTPIQYTAAGTITDGGATTQRIGAGTFVAGRVYEAANDAAVLYTEGGNDESEGLFGLTIDGAQVANNDTIELQLVQGDGTAFDIYTNTATLTVVKAAGTDAILANDVESLTETETVLLAQVQPLLSVSVESITNVSQPALVEVVPPNELLANDIESLVDISATTVSQIHSILANDLNSNTNTQIATLIQVHSITANSIESSAEQTLPTLSESNSLLADDINATSEVTIASVSQSHVLTSVSLIPTSEATVAVIGQVQILNANDLNSTSELSSPALVSGTSSDTLLASDIESTSELTTTLITQSHALLANDVESNSETSSSLLDGDNVAAISTELLYRIVVNVNLFRVVPIVNLARFANNNNGFFRVVYNRIIYRK